MRVRGSLQLPRSSLHTLDTVVVTGAGRPGCGKASRHHTSPFVERWCRFGAYLPFKLLGSGRARRVLQFFASWLQLRLRCRKPAGNASPHHYTLSITVEFVKHCALDMQEQPVRLGDRGPLINSPLGVGLWSWGDSLVRVPSWIQPDFHCWLHSVLGARLPAAPAACRLACH